MARRVRDANIESRAARGNLKASGKPYYKTIGEGLHVGYRKGNTRGGKWVVRVYIGDQNYSVETIAVADDVQDADGENVLNFWQAQEKARAISKERLAVDKPRAAGPYTVGDVLDEYLEEKEGGKSVKDSQLRIEALIRPKLGKIETAKLTKDHIFRWHRDLAKQPPRLRTKKGKDQKFAVLEDDDDSKRRRQATANRTLTILKAALNHAFTDRKIERDVAWRRVAPFKDVGAARVRYLTVAEAKRLVNACEQDFRKMVQVALQTGARYSELARLIVSDFNPDVGTLTIRGSKSGKARHVYLSEEGSHFFKSITIGRGSGEIMLAKADGSAWRTSHQARPMVEACKNAKIAPPIGFHGLRHTWASLATMNGVPLLVVAKNLGHADTRMVEKHYGHMSPSYIADAIRAGAPKYGTVDKSNNVVAIEGGA